MKNYKQLHSINVELLHANLEMLREIKEYCRKNHLPSPVLDDALSYRVQQLLDLTEDNNAIVNPSDDSYHHKRTDEELPEPCYQTLIDFCSDTDCLRFGSE